MRSIEEMEQLYKEHEKLIYATIHRRFGKKDFLEAHGLTFDDLVQHGRLGLHRACKEYDPTNTASFRSFAISNIYWTISVECKKESLSRTTEWNFKTINRMSFDSVETKDEEEGSLHELIGEEEKGYLAFEDKETEEYLLSVLERKLSKRMWQIVQLKLQGLTNEQVGEELGTTHQNVSAMLRYHKDKIKELIVA